VPKSPYIELPAGERCAILYEDRSVLAIDKPAGWMLSPSSWQRTKRNLQSVLIDSLKAGDFWARSRNLKFLRFVHRLDAETSGVLLLVKSPGGIRPYSRLFEGRKVEKVYLAAVRGVPAQREWVCQLSLAPAAGSEPQTRVDMRTGKPAETRFRVLQTTSDRALVEAHPLTGRMHQIRVHLAESGYPVLGDKL